MSHPMKYKLADSPNWLNKSYPSEEPAPPPTLPGPFSRDMKDIFFPSELPNVEMGFLGIGYQRTELVKFDVLAVVEKPVVTEWGKTRMSVTVLPHVMDALHDFAAHVKNTYASETCTVREPTYKGALTLGFPSRRRDGEEATIETVMGKCTNRQPVSKVVENLINNVPIKAVEAEMGLWVRRDVNHLDVATHTVGFFYTINKVVF